MEASNENQSPQPPAEGTTSTPGSATARKIPPPEPPVQLKGTLSGEELKDLGAEHDGEEREELTPAGAVQSAAGASKPERIAPEVQNKAMEWFMSEDRSAGEVETKTIRLNFGTDDNPEWVDWVLRPVGMDFMRRVRKQAANTREARKTGTVDEYLVNLKVVVAGTVSPNVAEAAQALYDQGRVNNPDAADVLRQRFQSKPGYIAQLAAHIMGLSGFDEEDVQEQTAQSAAGNS